MQTEQLKIAINSFSLVRGCAIAHVIESLHCWSFIIRLIYVVVPYDG